MAANIQSIIAQLRNLLDQPAGLPTAIPKLQQQIWSAPESKDDDMRWEILRDLAHDLDYYQPNPKVRSEDKALYGDGRAIEEIKQALAKLAE